MNKKIDIKTLMILVTRFRNALDHITPELSSDAFFSKFPNGCCGTTSDLLQFYLREHGIPTDVINGDFEYNNIKSSHTWLKYDNIYIDITADQFDRNIFPAVIVTEIENYPLNIHLKNIRLGINDTQNNTINSFNSLYSKIINYLNSK